MYSTIVNPTEYVTPYYTGSRKDACGNKVARHSMGPRQKSGGYVYSWRGKKDKSVCRNFRRFAYRFSGHESLWHCNNIGKMDGGNLWMYGLSNHPFLDPHMDLSPPAIEQMMNNQSYRNYVMADLFQKANEPTFNGAVFLAELGETVAYVTNLIRSFYSITKAYRNIASRVKDPASTWLEWRYAIQPLVLTIKDIIEALSDKRPKEKVQAYKAFDTVHDVDHHRFTYDFGSLLFKTHTTYNYRSGAALWIESQNDASPLGTSLWDTIMAAWEVVPASFIFDWFIDVGGWLGSLRNTDLVMGQRYASYVCNMRVKIWLEEGGSDIGALYSAPTQAVPFLLDAYIIDRITGNSVAPPILPCLVPGKLSLIHSLDATALTTGLLKSLRRK